MASPHRRFGRSTHPLQEFVWGILPIQASEESVPQRECSSGRAGRDGELVENVANMAIDGLFAQTKRGGDPAVGLALGDEGQHLVFAGR